MRILIRGAGDLATGIASRLYPAGHQIIMTECATPLTVRREVALSRAVYEKRAVVEGMTGVCCSDPDEAYDQLRQGNIAIIVDPEADCRKWFLPDVIVDAILAKKNMGTSLTDAPFVIGVGPGFSAGNDCHCVIETKRGHTLGSVIWKGEAIANTGVPGNVGGYTVERLIRASSDGIHIPLAAIGDFVSEGQTVAMSGDEPVIAQMSGIVRGMLQTGVLVEKGLKIGDIDARCDSMHCYTISDKARAIGGGVLEAVCRFSAMRGRQGIILLAAGAGSRFGGDKLHALVGGVPLYERMMRKLEAFSYAPVVVVTGDPKIIEAAESRDFLVAKNKEPEKGISHSIRLGLQCMTEHFPQVEGVLFSVCDQPHITVAVMQTILYRGFLRRENIICAAAKHRRGNPVYWGRIYFQELLGLTDDVGGRSLFHLHPEKIEEIEVDPEELLDIDRKEDLKEHDQGACKWKKL